MTDISKLEDKLKDLKYPNLMTLIKEKIPGRAFFPGGTGLFNENDKSLSGKDIMILGQDFDCETNYQKSLEAGEENITKNPTWRNLLSFLEELGISTDRCFFTNAIPGLRKGNVGTGKSPAFKDQEFIKKCRDYFLIQLAVQKPKIIFALGIHVAKFLSETSADLNCWKRIKNFAHVDQANNQVISANFDNGTTSNVILLTHPSFRNSNVYRRTCKDENFKGNAAEVWMVKSVLT